MFFSLAEIPDVYSAWYSWGVAIAFAVTFVTTLWIFFDSQSNDYNAFTWRWVSLLAAVIVIPSVIVSFSPPLALGLPTLLLDTLAILGILATAVSLASLLLYGLGVGVEAATVSDSIAESTAAMLAKTPRVIDPPTPPHGPLRTTQEKAVTPHPITPIANDTIRIKGADDDFPLAWVVVLNGPFTGQAFRLQKITDIGREREHNDIALGDRTISRQHARIRYEKGAFVIYDLASANGVFVNGVAVQRRVLTHGDRIKLGQIMLGVLMVQEDVFPEGATDAELTTSASSPTDA